MKKAMNMNDFNSSMALRNFYEHNHDEMNRCPFTPFYNTLIEVKRKIGVEFGPEMIEYLTTYGYLSFGSVEFYGLYQIDLEKTDLVKNTNYLHKTFPKTKQLIALENRGDGEYCLVDNQDYVYVFDCETEEIVPLKEKVFDYMLRRFKSEY